MTPMRVVLAAGSVVLIDAAVANILLWHRLYWIPIGWYSIILLLLALFEVGRYQPRVDRSMPSWRKTGERFFDPTTGEATTVFYDPATGQRDYRRDPGADVTHTTTL